VKSSLFFRIKHFAGSVTYNVEGFLAKNNDILEADLSRFMFNCQHPLLKLLFPEGNF
jgi:myosin heavy subunit